MKDGNDPNLAALMMSDLKTLCQKDYSLKMLDLIREITEIFKIFERDMEMLGGRERRRTLLELSGPRKAPTKPFWLIKPYDEVRDKLFELDKFEPVDRELIRSQVDQDRKDFDQFRIIERNKLLGIEVESAETDPKLDRRKYDCTKFRYSVNDFHKGMKAIKSHTISASKLSSKASLLCDQIDSILFLKSSNTVRRAPVAVSSKLHTSQQKGFRISGQNVKSAWHSTALSEQNPLAATRRSLGDLDRTFEKSGSLLQQAQPRNKWAKSVSTRERTNPTERGYLLSVLSK